MKKITLLLLILAVATATPAGAFFLPDSDQRKCYRDEDPFDPIPCAGTGQDGVYHINPLRYALNGNGTVTDKNTGLMWQRLDDNTQYNWYQASGTYHAIYNLTSQNVCGESSLGGHTDWRLPSKKELLTIVDYAVTHTGPHIKSYYFPGTEAALYWASTVAVYDADKAWTANFSSANINAEAKSTPAYVRCVRGGQEWSKPNLFDKGNGTVRDSRTGLVWQKGEGGYMYWGSALDYCEQLKLGGARDWRLPNAKELESLADDRRTDPAIDANFFPGISGYPYWTSTTHGSEAQFAESLDPFYGSVYGLGKTTARTFSSDIVDGIGGARASQVSVRCVRGGRPMLLVRPNGGEQVHLGQQYSIAWEYSGLTGKVSLLLYRGDKVSTIKTGLFIGKNGSGFYKWLVPATLKTGDDYRVEVFSEQDPTRRDKSDGTFSILP